MSKGRPPKADRAKSHSSGHRALPGQGRSPSAAALPVACELALLPPPEGVPPVAAEAWRVVLAEMASTRILRRVDLMLVEAFCEAAYVHHEASANIHTYGVLVKGSHGPMPNPMIRVQKDAAGTMRQLSDALGLNPLARIRGNLIEVSGTSIALGIRERLFAQLGE